ncbi:hypothetical protein FB39_004407 [Salmonella enterica subsp. diarizonae]|nr:hypothetical protein [Salmonella enterica subsp. diarizonae]
MTIDKQTLCIENAFDIENQLYELANNEIECDSFAVTSTNENGTEIEFERPITDLALEAASTINALLKRLESKEKLVADLASQLDVQLARSNALALKNARMTSFINAYLDIAIQGGALDGFAVQELALKHGLLRKEEYCAERHRDMVYAADLKDGDDVYFRVENPATDAFLAEVRASAIEAFADNQAKIADEELVGGNLDLSLRFRGMARAAKEFAAQIRQEAAK